MNNFLSNIDIGVFDLDEVFEQGFGALMPSFLRDQVARQNKKVRDLVRQRAKVIELIKKAQREQEKQQEKLLRKYKQERLDPAIESGAQELLGARAEQAGRRSSIGGRIMGGIKTAVTSPFGRGALLASGALLTDIQRSFGQIQRTAEETGFFSSKLLQDFDRIGTKSKEIVVSGERLYNSVTRNFDTFVNLRQEFGATENLSIEILDNISQLENIIGISNEEATDLLSTFKGINRESIQANTALVKTFAVLANQNGVAFRDVMQDITDNADFFATYMADSSEKMGELIVKSRRMGLSFSTFANALTQFQDIEGTIEKQMRLSIFAGQQMDLMSIMESVYAGNIQQAGQQLLTQIGGVNTGLLDNPLVKQQFMEALGVDATTFNKLTKVAKGDLTFQERINRDLAEGLENFNENFRQLGFGTLKKDFTQFIINPLSNLFKDNREELQDMVNVVGGLIKAIGTMVTWVAKAIVGLQKGIDGMFGSGGALASMATMVGIAGTIAMGVNKMFGTKAIETAQLAELTQIKNILAGDVLSGGGGGGGLFSRIYGRKPIKGGGGKFRDPATGRFVSGGGRRGGWLGSTTGKGLGGTALAVGSGLAGYAGGFSLGGLLSATGTGALAGAPIGGWGALGGAVIGGGSYLLGSAFSDDPPVKMARGGIFKKRYTGMMDIGEAGKPEAITPLDVEDGKPTMPTKLADDSIRKLSEAMSKMKFMGEVKMPDGSKKTIEFYNSVMQPSSALNT